MSTTPFDASLKDLVDFRPVDWATWLGAKNARSVRVIDADVSTVTAAGDKALQVDDDFGEYVLHPELQSSYDVTLPHRTWWASAVYHKRTKLRVSSTAILLRPEA